MKKNTKKNRLLEMIRNMQARFADDKFHSYSEMSGLFCLAKIAEVKYGLKEEMISAGLI